MLHPRNLLLIATLISCQFSFAQVSIQNNNSHLKVTWSNDYFNGDPILPCLQSPPPIPNLDHWWYLGPGTPPVYKSLLDKSKFLIGGTNAVDAYHRKIYTDDEDFGVVSSTPNFDHNYDHALFVNAVNTSMGTTSLPVIFSLPEKIGQGASPSQFEVSSFKGSFFIGLSTATLTEGLSYTLSWETPIITDSIILDFPTLDAAFSTKEFWVWDAAGTPALSAALAYTSIDLINREIIFTPENIGSAEMVFLWFYYPRCLNETNTIVFSLRETATSTSIASANVDVVISEDPNVKCVDYPVNQVCEVAEYTIRFVNEGGAPTEAVIISDWIPDNIDPNSIFDVEYRYGGESFRPKRIDVALAEIWNTELDRTHQIPREEIASSPCTFDNIYGLESADSTGYYVQEERKLAFVLFTAEDDTEVVLDQYDDSNYHNNWPFSENNVGYVRYKARTKKVETQQATPTFESPKGDITEIRNRPANQDIFPYPAFIEFDCFNTFVQTGTCHTEMELGNPQDMVQIATDSYFDSISSTLITRFKRDIIGSSTILDIGLGFGESYYEVEIPCGIPYPELRLAEEDLDLEISVGSGSESKSFSIKSGEYIHDRDGIKLDAGLHAITISTDDFIRFTHSKTLKMEASLWEVTDNALLKIELPETSTVVPNVQALDSFNFLSGRQYLVRINIGLETSVSGIETLPYLGNLRETDDWNRRTIDMLIQIR